MYVWKITAAILCKQLLFRFSCMNMRSGELSDLENVLGKTKWNFCKKLVHSLVCNTDSYLQSWPEEVSGFQINKTKYKVHLVNHNNNFPHSYDLAYVNMLLALLQFTEDVFQFEILLHRHMLWCQNLTCQIPKFAMKNYILN